MKLSPMMQQYMDIKAEYPDTILFFRLGDFYEMFFDDAKLVSKLLELTLTGKSCGLEERAPMCGVPFHAADSYIGKLVEKGYSVAICEQLEDPATTKGMVKRGVIRVVTPGTLTSGTMLSERENNYIASATLDKDNIGLSYADISTGELFTTEFPKQVSGPEDLINELVKINAKEILISEELEERIGEDFFSSQTGAFVKTLSSSYFSERAAISSIKAQYSGLSMQALGIDGRNAAIQATGALLSYLLETQKQDLSQITSVRYYDINNHMALDKATMRNLELLETLYDKKTDGSLLGVLDKTRTAMGARKLKQWIREPLKNTDEINARLDAVSALYEDRLSLNDLREQLNGVYDFERLTGRMASGNANGKDMIALRNSISFLPDIKDICASSGSRLLRDLADNISDLMPIHDLIEKGIEEEPPMTVTEGSLIKEGFSEELDDLKASIKDAKSWIATLESKEKKRTGITHLKVGYNKVFGYYIEISRSNLDMVPDDYIRKQTLVGAERFITPKLKEVEGLVLNAETKINKLEYEIFSDIRKEIAERTGDIQKTSQAVSEIDVLAGFAYVAIANGYTRPEVDTGDVIDIENGRHPVVERNTDDGLFVSNDTYMNRDDASMLIITGPNMAGKSTYMRQTALIVLMAQAGSFVPADKALIGVTDRIFTRIGASDNLARGESTFFVEMSELAYILRNATERSLVILDEIGRGTSTYDGLSIAWATVEHLCNEDSHIRTMFATHYHELTSLEEEIAGVKNLNIDVAEENGKVVFLHRIIPGSANRSYGVHVADLAGVPRDLLENAGEKLRRLENESDRKSVRDAFMSSKNDDKEPYEKESQISFFSQNENPAIRKLKDLDLMETKPSEAFAILEELKELADKE